MGDVIPSSRPKELVPSSIQCPMLTTTNYTVWAMRMKVLLRIHKVWETIEHGSNDPDKNDVAIGLLFQSIPENLILQVGDQKTSKEIWESIKSRNLGAERVKEARLQTLMSEFERIRMIETDTIDSFAGKLSEIASKSASLGQTIDEAKLVKKFLHSLPRNRYIQIIASLEQVLDLNKTSFEDIIGRLKAYEERILDEENFGDQNKLLFSNTNQQTFMNSRGRGHGRGGRGFGGRRGRGRTNFNAADDRKNQANQTKDKSKVICYRCEKAGHYASRCPEKQQKNEEANKLETVEADVALYMNEIVFLNEERVIPQKFESNEMAESIWYLDNGASNHMTGKKHYFSEFNERIKGKVKFGDGSFVNIEGKGSILFQGKRGEQKLITNIYYIPSLESNILSLGQATESGCDVRMRHE